MDNKKMPTELEVMKMSLFIKVMADSTRVKILFAIKDKPKSVAEIQELVGATQSAVSHQLSLMRRVNIVATKRDGNKIYYSLADNGISKVLEIVRNHIWHHLECGLISHSMFCFLWGFVLKKNIKKKVVKNGGSIKNGTWVFGKSIG